MNWGAPATGPTSPPPFPVPKKDDEKGRSAVPPECPRCSLTKNQFNRTIQNYQKAYRKKVEGLKTELKATRNTNEALRRQVRQLKSATRVHIPSLAVGLAVGLAGIWLPRLRSYFTGKQQQQRGDAEQPKEEAADGSSSQEQQQQQQVQQGGAQSIPEEAVKADSAA